MCVSEYTQPFIDHKNRDKSDNTRSNLRFCTPSQNNINRGAYGKSKYNGVFPFIDTRKRLNKELEKKRKMSKPKFISKISVNGKKIHLGTFINEIDAAKAYNEAAKKYHGEFANLNIVD